jgi:hypothetical protein
MARTVVPVQGTPGVFDARNPTLVPNFDRPTYNGNTIDHSSPAVFDAASARADATMTITVAGTMAATDTITATITFGSNVVTETYTLGAGDTTAALAAAGLVNVINSDQVAAGFGIYATAVGAVITIRFNGPIGNSAVVTTAVGGGGGALETLTMSPVSGKLSGGTGPIIPTGNFTWAPGGGAVTSFWYGQPAIVGFDQLTNMLSQGMPIT